MAMTDLQRSHAELRAAVILAGKEIRKLNFGRPRLIQRCPKLDPHDSAWMGGSFRVFGVFGVFGAVAIIGYHARVD
jgi:hypothetical protein